MGFELLARVVIRFCITHPDSSCHLFCSAGRRIAHTKESAASDPARRHPYPSPARRNGFPIARLGSVLGCNLAGNAGGGESDSLGSALGFTLKSRAHRGAHTKRR